MSYQNAQSYSSFSSSSYSSSTDSSGNTYTESTISNPSGTTIHRTTQKAGQAPVAETTRLPAGGTQQVEGVDNTKRIEDVTDADREYEERIEDEYAKREGGAWEGIEAEQKHALMIDWSVDNTIWLIGLA